jgi:hypothetical protein
MFNFKKMFIFFVDFQISLKQVILYCLQVFILDMGLSLLTSQNYSQGSDLLISKYFVLPPNHTLNQREPGASSSSSERSSCSWISLTSWKLVGSVINFTINQNKSVSCSHVVTHNLFFLC